MKEQSRGAGKSRNGQKGQKLSEEKRLDVRDKANGLLIVEKDGVEVDEERTGRQKQSESSFSAMLSAVHKRVEQILNFEGSTALPADKATF